MSMSYAAPCGEKIWRLGYSAYSCDSLRDTPGMHTGARHDREVFVYDPACPLPVYSVKVLVHPP